MRISECERGTVIDAPDERVIHSLESSHEFAFDPLYLQMLPQIHGGVPKRCYFETQRGHVRRIGWYLTLLDEHSTLTPPFQPSADYYDERDTRIADRCIAELISYEGNCFVDGERIVPFASLYTMHFANGELMHPNDLHLRPLDWVTCDSVCFDRSSNPHGIVVCHADAACRASSKWDDRAEREMIQYDDFIEPVADSFRDFLDGLTDQPSNSSVQ